MIRIVKIHFVIETAVVFLVNMALSMVGSAINIVQLLSQSAQHATDKTVVYLLALDAVPDIMLTRTFA